MKKYLFALFFLPATFVHAQLTDHNIHGEPPPPTLPPAGGTFVDPTFNTTLLRVTDANDGNDNHHAYAYWPCMNMNSTRLYIMQTNIGPTLYDFDANNFAIANKRAAFAGNCPSSFAPNAEDAIWSDVDPDIIFVHDRDMHLYAYNVSTLTYALVKDMSGAFPNGAISWQMNKCHTSDDLFSFTWKDASYNTAGVFAWRSSTDQFYIFNQTDADECQPDRAGNHLIIKLTGSGQFTVQARIADLQNNTIADITDGGPGNPSTPGLYWAPGHGDMGNGTVLGHDDWNNRLLGRTCTNPSAFYSVFDFNNDWSQDYHGSHLADDVNWILISPYVSNTLPNSGLYKNEILLVATDGSQNVRRLAHHHCDYVSDYNANGGGNAYWSSPKASISKDGNWAVFTSNWGSTTRKDVFILKVPPVITSTAEQNSSNPQLTVLSDPLNKRFTFNCSEGIFFIEIYDMLGRKMFSSAENSSSVSLDVPGFPGGVYFYRVAAGMKPNISGRIMVIGN
ncbi:MAG TPA: T9SS type A sorting domain-containing protein [Bacteroidia bacterium]|jgi:hypothetical protein